VLGKKVHQRRKGYTQPPQKGDRILKRKPNRKETNVLTKKQNKLIFRNVQFQKLPLGEVKKKILPKRGGFPLEKVQGKKKVWNGGAKRVQGGGFSPKNQ